MSYDNEESRDYSKTHMSKRLSIERKLTGACTFRLFKTAEQ